MYVATIRNKRLLTSENWRDVREGCQKEPGRKKEGENDIILFQLRYLLKKRYLLKTKYLHNKQMIPDSPRPAQLCTKIKVQRHSVGLTN